MYNNMQKKKSIYSVLRGDFISNQNSQKNFPFILLIVILLLLNIRISFHAENLTLEIISLEQEIYDLRLTYITTKSDLMHLHKRSEIEVLVKDIGLNTSMKPPIIIQDLNEE